MKKMKKATIVASFQYDGCYNYFCADLIIQKEVMEINTLSGMSIELRRKLKRKKVGNLATYLG